MADQGSYSIRAINPVGFFNASVSLTVYGKYISHIFLANYSLTSFFIFYSAVRAYIEQVGSSDLVANADESTSLECRADGLPLPFIVWLKDDRLVLSSQDKIQIQTNRISRGLRTILDESVSSVLTITNLNPSDSGFYKCRAANNFSVTEPLSYSLTVVAGQPSDYCTPNPCRNRGRCISGEFTFVCDCRTGFIGTICDTGEQSHNEPCYYYPCDRHLQLKPLAVYQFS